MKRSVKILIIIGIFVIAVVITALFIINSISKSGLPDYNAVVDIEGLKDEVKVYRDEYGVPHIFAQNEEDLYKVTGYISAQDRMWQMDLLRRVTQGRLSEIFGEDMINSDVFLRSLRIPEKSELTLKHSSPEIISALKAYADGVNQYIKNYENDLSFEFTVLGYSPDLWKPENSLNLIGYMAWGLKSGWNYEPLLYKLKNILSESKFKEIFPDLDMQTTCVYPELNDEIEDSSLISGLQKINNISPGVFDASNNWVVAGSKSTTGKPIFANDMHLGLMIPGVWSQIHQHVEGKLDVTGVILPGQPLVVTGHNKNIAWGMTNVGTDGSDFYIETINPENENQYKFNGEWKDLQVRTEKIYIKGIEEPVEKELKFTHRGPVISGFKKIKDKTISMHWIGNDPDDVIRTVFLLNRAKNWNDFRDALKTFKSLSQNVAYADIEGNIGLQCAGGIPVRKAPGYFFFPGETDEYDWKGTVPFDSLPYSYNPECGYVFSANNRTVGDDYPYYISIWYDLPYRADRIKQMLTEKEILSVQDFKTMQNDTKSVLAEQMSPVIIKHLEEVEDLNEQEKQALEILKSWDFVYSKDKIAPTIFEKFYVVLGENLMSDEMPEELYSEFKKMELLTRCLIDKIIETGNSEFCDDVNTENVETFEDMVQISLKETIVRFEEEHGKKIVDTKWGEINKFSLIQPLGKNKLMNFIFSLNRSYPTGGSFHTVNIYKYVIHENTAWGASQRHIYNTADFDESFTIIPTGVSGIPSSKHYCDQSEMYVNGIYHYDYTSIDKVKKKAKYTAVFKPATK